MKHIVKFVMFVFSILVLAGCATTAPDKDLTDSRYTNLLSVATQTEEVVDKLIGVKPDELIVTLGEPTEIKEWGDESYPLFVYQLDNNSKLSIWIAKDRAVKALLILMSN